MILNVSGKTAREVNWDTPGLDKDAFRESLKMNPSFRLAFLRDRTEYFEEFISHRL